MKLKPSIFRKAAKIVENNHDTFGCHAIRKALFVADWRHLSKDSKAYTDLLFKVFSTNQNSVIWNFPDNKQFETDSRIIGLLLCAELVQDGFTTSDFT